MLSHLPYDYYKISVRGDRQFELAGFVSIARSCFLTGDLFWRSLCATVIPPDTGGSHEHQASPY